MNRNYVRLASVIYLAGSITAGGLANTPTDYSTLKHRLFVDQLRGGNHDPSGMNDYYFTAQTVALRNTKDDLSTELDTRKRVSNDPLEFAPLQVQALTTWKPDPAKPEEGAFVDIDGDKLRTLVTKAMREFAVREDELAVMVEVKLFEKAKRFYFFGNDTEVGKTKYYPVPASQFQAAARTNLKLSIIDDKGTDVILKVKYDSQTATSQ